MKMRNEDFRKLQHAYDEYRDFVVFLSVDYDDFFRRHLIEAVAKQLRGRSKILCVNRPICPVVTTIKYRKKMAMWLKCLFYKDGSLRKLGDNLYLYTPFLFLHDQLAPKISFIRKANRKILYFQLSRILRKLKFDMDKLIVWIFNPYQVDYLDLLNEKYLIYDCYDEYLDPITFRDNSLLRQLEEKDRQIIRKADIVFAASELIVEKRRELNKNTYYLPNAADYNHFNKAFNKKTPIPDDIASIPHPIIGFVGNMNQSIDFNLLTYLSRKKPEWSLVLVGPFKYYERGFLHLEELREARSCKNIYFVGGKPFEQIPSYLKAFDVCLIPYRDSEFNRSRSPVKLFEYMASGKPIVSTPVHQCQHFEGVIEIAKEPQSFLEAIAKLLTGDHKITQNYLMIAKENSWEKRADRVLEIITQYVRGQA